MANVPGRQKTERIDCRFRFSLFFLDRIKAFVYKQWTWYCDCGGKLMKSGGGLLRFNALTSATLALALAAPMLGQVTLTVDATMDIYRAGGYNDGSDGVAPAVYTFTAQPFQTLTFSGVNGMWKCTTGLPAFGPDGTTTGCNPSQTINNPIGTFSGLGLTDFIGPMVGIFLEDTLPASAPPPSMYYTPDDSVDQHSEEAD